MTRNHMVRNALDYIVQQYDAVRGELAKPHGQYVEAGLRSGAKSGAAGLATGILAYAIARGTGASPQTAMRAAKYWGGIGASAGFLGGYAQHAGSRQGWESLKNMMFPAVNYARGYKFA
jgi:hypothetical protein